MADRVESRYRRWIGEPQLRLAYLVHNLGDPAVAKRVRMLRAFGDQVLPIGFHRDDRSVASVEGIPAVDLGRTFDANFRQRLTMMLRQIMSLADWARPLRDCDVVIARNLEMLLLGAVARRRYAPRASLVYEALDIHRLLLSESILGTLMRALERILLRRADLLIVSSPAFLREYFEPMQRLGKRSAIDTLIVENKLLPASRSAPRPVSVTSSNPAPPWRIGWFGMIRCRKSLDYLCDLARRRPDLLRLIIRGRPSYTEFADFDGQIAQTPAASFGGAYGPEEVGTLYGNVHFNWAIDFFEEGANSRWLLPNRVYEGGAFGAVPIAIEGTETARWLRQRGVGVVLPALEAFDEFLGGLTSERYAQLKAASEAAPESAFIAGEGDCRRLLDAVHRGKLRRLRQARRSGDRGFALATVAETRDDAPT